MLVGGACRHGSAGCSVLVDEVLQFLAWLEIRNALRRNFHFFSRLGIASDACVALSNPEAAESAHFKLVAHAKRLYDAFEQRIDYDFRILSSQLRNLGYFFHEVCLGHYYSLRN